MRVRSTLFALLVACSSKQSDPVSQPKKIPPPITKSSSEQRPIGVPLPEIVMQQMPLEQVPAPWTLTATDGSGLLATRIDAKAVVQGPLAFTELHLYFANTENRVREGTFAITLPPSAAVSRFAMETDGQMMEAEVVEKQLARRAYDDFLHRKQDPALMEKAPGNQFTAKVFPIPAKGVKHIVVSFSQELPGERYTMPLRGLPKVEQLDVELTTTNVDGSRVSQAMHEKNWQPDKDFVSNSPLAAEAIASGELVIAQVSPFDQSSVAKDEPKTMTLLVDTSASRALGFQHYASNINELVSTLGARYQGLTISVIAFDQDTQEIYKGPATGFGQAQVSALLARGAAGASDIGQALDKLDRPGDRIAIITDGVITAGSEDLPAKVKALAAKQVARVDVVMAGGIRDEALAMSLVTAGLPHTGAVLDLDQRLGEVASGLGERVITDATVEVAGATWVYPRVIKSARPNQRMMVFAKFDKPQQTIDVKIGSSHRNVGTVGGTPALVERAVASAEIAELEGKEQTKEVRAEIVKKSVAARVISNETSMLVLESNGDYARYGIDRNALADILVVGPNGVEQKNRTLHIAKTTAKPQQHAKGNKNAEIALHDTTTEDARMGITKEGGVEGGVAGGVVGGEASGVSSGEMRISGDMEMSAPEPAKVAVLDSVVVEDDEKMKAKEEKDDKKPEAPTMHMRSDPQPAEPAAAPPPPPPPPPTMIPPPAADTTPTTGAPARLRRPSSDVSPRNAPSDYADVPGVVSGGYAEQQQAWPGPDKPSPLKGKLAEIDRAIKKGTVDAALAKAQEWHDKQPGDVLALIGLGESLEAKKDLAQAARIYGSIIDLFPGRADLRRFAGERLERIGDSARSLAVDTYRRAVEERPDHMTGHRLLAYALLRNGQHADAFDAILKGLEQKYRDDSYAGGMRVLTEDAGLIGAAYLAAQPDKKADILAALKKHNATLATRASTRFIMYWETDANDVDFHIQDSQGGHAFYGAKVLPSGGELYADITTGYGPECFTIMGKPKAGPYKLSIDYYSQGPMGYGMGLLQIVKFDGKGKLDFQDRPYVIMNDHAYVNLGKF